MAKSKSFFGLRRGSTKSHTYQVNNGQQITKDRVYGGRNPRSDGQMTQRSTFLSAVRFYQRANQHFFRFAFESKTQTESDYNAFMRHNAKIGPYITKAQGDAIGYPMVAPWVLSQGSLETPATSIQAIGSTGNGALMLIADEYSETTPSTIGQVSALILAKYASLRAGDYITMVVIESKQADGWYNDLDATSIPVVSPNWMIKQIRLDPTDEGSLALAGVLAYKLDGKCYLGYLVPTARNILGCAFVASRDESTGVKVSTTTIVLGEDAQTAYEAMRTNAHRELVMSWWGAQQQAILQGAIANAQGGSEPVVKSIPAMTITAGTTRSNAVTPVGFEAPLMDRFIQSVTVRVTINGNYYDHILNWDDEESDVRCAFTSGILSSAEYMYIRKPSGVNTIDVTIGSSINDYDIVVEVLEINRAGVVIYP